MFKIYLPKIYFLPSEMINDPHGLHSGVSTMIQPSLAWSSLVLAYPKRHNTSLTSSHALWLNCSSEIPEWRQMGSFIIFNSIRKPDFCTKILIKLCPLATDGASLIWAIMHEILNIMISQLRISSLVSWSGWRLPWIKQEYYSTWLRVPCHSLKCITRSSLPTCSILVDLDLLLRGKAG